MDALSNEILDALGGFFAKPQPDLPMVGCYETDDLLNKEDVKSYAALVASCKAIHAACKERLDGYHWEHEERVERYGVLQDCKRFCDMEDIGFPDEASDYIGFRESDSD